MLVGSLDFQLILAFPHIRLAVNLRKFKRIGASEAKGQERIPAAAGALRPAARGGIFTASGGRLK